MNQSLRQFYDQFWPIPQPGDELPPEGPEPRLKRDFTPGEEVVIHGRNVEYTGNVLDVDPYENRVVVRYYDPKLGKHQTRKWAIGRVHPTDTGDMQ